MIWSLEDVEDRAVMVKYPFLNLGENFWKMGEKWVENSFFPEKNMGVAYFVYDRSLFPVLDLDTLLVIDLLQQPVVTSAY